MIWLCFVLLAFQEPYSHCSYHGYRYENHENEIEHKVETLSVAEVQELDASVKKRLISDISTKWNSTYEQLEKSTNKYDKQCEARANIFFTDCEKCCQSGRKRNPSVKSKRRRMWGKRDAEGCTKKCSSCRRLLRAKNTNNFDDICGINVEGNNLRKLLEELDKNYPNVDIPIVTRVSREWKKGKERTVVKMTIKDKSREIWLPDTMFDQRSKFAVACLNVYKKNGGKILM